METSICQSKKSLNIFTWRAEIPHFEIFSGQTKNMQHKFVAAEY
jgi:hypothetical protein